MKKNTTYGKPHGCTKGLVGHPLQRLMCDVQTLQPMSTISLVLVQPHASRPPWETHIGCTQKHATFTFAQTTLMTALQPMFLNGSKSHRLGLLCSWCKSETTLSKKLITLWWLASCWLGLKKLLLLWTICNGFNFGNFHLENILFGAKKNTFQGMAWMNIIKPEYNK